MNSRHCNCVGAVTVEFAIVVPLLVMVVFGITELGRALYELNTLTKSTATGVRYLSRVPGYVAIDEDGETVCQKGTDPEVVNPEGKAENLIKYGSENAGEKTLLIDMGIETPFYLRDEQITIAGKTKTVCIIGVETRATYTSVFGDAGPIIPFTDIDAFNMYQTVEERYIGE